MSNEARVVINGRELTPQQTMAMRVAVSNMRGEMLGPNPLGNDAHGIKMAAAYAQALGEVERLLCMVGIV